MKRDDTIQFSVVVPTFNRPQQLYDCLAALSMIELEGRFEVIVVDDGGDTDLESVAVAYKNRLRVRWFRTAHRGPAYARNVGVMHAAGKWVAFTDDDCRVDPDWLGQFQSHFSRHPDGLLGGQTYNLLKNNVCSMASQLIIDMVYAFYNKDESNAQFFTSNNMALSKRLFQKVGGFDADFGIASEDRDFCDRWHLQGLQKIFCPAAVVHHAHALSVRSFMRQHFRYGRGAVHYHRARQNRGTGSIIGDFGFHLKLPHLIMGKIRDLNASKAWGVVMLLSIWQLAYAGGVCYEKLFGRGRQQECSQCGEGR
jgi:GT2 family glycosyltransferase